MDLNPDEAIAAGWLRNNSLTARILDRMSRFSLKEADRVIVLTGSCRNEFCGNVSEPDKVAVIPPWSHDDAVRFDAAGREQFRKAHGLDGKFVVMYSGNHSPCHPLDTLLTAASALKEEQDIAFCFVGGGSEFARVKEFGTRRQLANIVCLPYQARDQIAGSLSAADLHVVVMGDAFVGITHPCKIYNALRVFRADSLHRPEALSSVGNFSGNRRNLRMGVAWRGRVWWWKRFAGSSGEATGTETGFDKGLIRIPGGRCCRVWWRNWKVRAERPTDQRRSSETPLRGTEDAFDVQRSMFDVRCFPCSLLLALSS